MKVEKKLQDHAQYLQHNLLLKQILHDFMSNVLVHQPLDVFHFAKQYFSNLQDSVKQKTAAKSKVLIIAGAVTSAFKNGRMQLAERLRTDFPREIEVIVSHTTRPKRLGEVNGIHHHFITEEDIETNNIEFVESTDVGEEFYGTSREEFERVVRSGGRIGLMFLDTQGAEQIVEQRDYLGVECRGVYLKPKSIEHVKEAMKERKVYGKEAIEKRIKLLEEEACQLPQTSRIHNYTLFLEADPESAEEVYKKIHQLIMDFATKDL
jgi:guanylate kinase